MSGAGLWSFIVTLIGLAIVIALVIILGMAAKALLGGGLGFINIGNFGIRHGEFGIPFHVANSSSYLSAMLI